MHLAGKTFGEVLRRLQSSPPPSARAALLHMLWTQELCTGLGEVLTDEVLLTAGSRHDEMAGSAPD